MSNDREEIRWKLQVLSEMMSDTLAEHENERKYSCSSSIVASANYLSSLN